MQDDRSTRIPYNSPIRSRIARKTCQGFTHHPLSTAARQHHIDMVPSQPSVRSPSFTVSISYKNTGSSYHYTNRSWSIGITHGDSILMILDAPDLPFSTSTACVLAADQFMRIPPRRIVLAPNAAHFEDKTKQRIHPHNPRRAIQSNSSIPS